MKIQSAAKSLLFALLSVASLARPACAAQTPPAGQPAVWQPYDMILHLEGLPRAYSCDELWYKFRGVLIVIGAGRIDEVAPTGCASTSPSVHLRFVLPRVVSGDDARYSEIQADRRPVELAPGKPEHLRGDDCVLVRQMKESLLADLPIKVVGARFECGRAPASGAAGPARAARQGNAYRLRIEALLPIWPAAANDALPGA